MKKIILLFFLSMHVFHVFGSEELIAEFISFDVFQVKPLYFLKNLGWKREVRKLMKSLGIDFFGRNKKNAPDIALGVLNGEGANKKFAKLILLHSLDVKNGKKEATLTSINTMIQMIQREYKYLYNEAHDVLGDEAQGFCYLDYNHITSPKYKGGSFEGGHLLGGIKGWNATLNKNIETFVMAPRRDYPVLSFVESGTLKTVWAPRVDFDEIISLFNNSKLLATGLLTQLRMNPVTKEAVLVVSRFDHDREWPAQIRTIFPINILSYPQKIKNSDLYGNVIVGKVARQSEDGSSIVIERDLILNGRDLIDSLEETKADEKAVAYQIGEDVVIYNISDSVNNRLDAPVDQSYFMWVSVEVEKEVKERIGTFDYVYERSESPLLSYINRSESPVDLDAFWNEGELKPVEIEIVEAH